jgi:TPR repeat protein
MKESARWLIKAAESGHAPAEERLGWQYATGQGVPLDYVAAYSWYQLAAAGGDAPAMKATADLSRIMTAKQLQAAEAQFLTLQSLTQSQKLKPSQWR